MALVPQGYMLDAPGSGNTIVICTVDGLVTIPDPTQPQRDKPDHSLCSFSLHAQPVLIAAAVAMAVELPVTTATNTVRVAGDIHSRRYTPLLPRAPPTA